MTQDCVFSHQLSSVLDHVVGAFVLEVALELALLALGVANAVGQLGLVLCRGELSLDLDRGVVQSNSEEGW